jgi:hypothetical protein
MKNATGNASRPVPGGTDAAAGSVPARRVGDGAGPGMVRMAGVIHCSCLAFFNLHCVFRILVLEASPCFRVGALRVSFCGFGRPQAVDPAAGGSGVAIGALGVPFHASMNPAFGFYSSPRLHGRCGRVGKRKQHPWLNTSPISRLPVRRTRNRSWRSAPSSASSRKIWFPTAMTRPRFRLTSSPGRKTGPMES